MTDRAIIGTAILIGWSPEGKCVYSAAIPLDDYRDGEHAWDTDSGVRRLGLEKLRGFLFDSQGILIEEFENNYDVATGRNKDGWAKHADGTFERHGHP